MDWTTSLKSPRQIEKVILQSQRRITHPTRKQRTTVSAMTTIKVYNDNLDIAVFSSSYTCTRSCDEVQVLKLKLDFMAEDKTPPSANTRAFFGSSDSYSCNFFLNACLPLSPSTFSHLPRVKFKTTLSSQHVLTIRDTQLLHLSDADSQSADMVRS